uniref:RNA polymerase sigma factor SigA n=2 Tax=Paenarthrobacter TaxID=1742992 RepID=A0A345BEM1_PAEUR|nr:RNA polymerase sigma factor SigA [Paenarthrobacter ureafaciens]
MHAVNARMRQEWLQAALDYSTSDSETERDSAKLRMEEICTSFLVKNRKLAMSGAKDFLAHAGSLTSDYEQVAMMALWEAFAGTDPTLMHQVSWRTNPADTASAELLARVAEADQAAADHAAAGKEPEDLEEEADVVAYRESVRAYQDAIDRGLYLVGATGWDPAKSTFGGYSRVFIRGAVQRAVANNESGLSYALWSHRPKVETARKAWIERHGSEPSVAELAKMTGLRPDTVRAITTPAPVSADTPIGENFTIADTLADKQYEELGDDRDLISDVVAAAAADGDIKPMDLMSLLC